MNKIGTFRAILLLFFYMASHFQAQADYFQWELQIFLEGPGSMMEVIPVTIEGPLYKWGEQGACHIKDQWTQIVSELIIEGKTLFCINGQHEQTINLICRDNHGIGLKHESSSHHMEGLFLEDSKPHEAPFLRFRCYL